MRFLIALFLFGLSLAAAAADGPKDNIPDSVRRVPPPGVKVPDDDRAELEMGLKKLHDVLLALEQANDAHVRELLPDVAIYFKAVHDALTYDEFFNVKEVATAKNLLKIGLVRGFDLGHGNHPWTTQTGLVVRGYRSKIDGSVQPYGLVIPKSFDFKTKIRLDFWCHGRGENLSEVNFINSCQSSPGQFASEKAIVVNLYGRYCCANKLAGEVDCFEALEDIKKHYPIDESRLVMRGFSMGGAAAWHFAAHYPGFWCAAAPGAGFSETPDFLRVFQKEDVSAAPPWEKKLWHMYDCTDYALNFFNLPTVAYSGEVDSQKQAADIMAKAMKSEGLELVHLIGPKTGHGYEKAAKAELIERIDKIVDKGRNPVPEKIKFVTYTLHYNTCFWLKITGLKQHWERAQVDAEITGKDSIKITTKNVTGLVLDFPADSNAFAPGKKASVEIDGQKLELSALAAGPFHTAIERRGDSWAEASGVKAEGLAKTPRLQGPIDDAFLSSFVMVRPTGKPLNEATGKWFEAEMKHALTHWRLQFRGAAPVKDDKDVTDDDIKNSNLVLWGDPSSNQVLQRIAGKLPIAWKDGKIVVGSSSFDGATHVPLLIYPNPLNPKKYVVLNSGFTFREYDYLNNARQVPKLPDYAIVDVTSRPNARYPGKIAVADFFNEKWELPASR